MYPANNKATAQTMPTTMPMMIGNVSTGLALLAFGNVVVGLELGEGRYVEVGTVELGTKLKAETILFREMAVNTSAHAVELPMSCLIMISVFSNISNIPLSAHRGRRTPT